MIGDSEFGAWHSVMVVILTNIYGKMVSEESWNHYWLAMHDYFGNRPLEDKE